MKKSKKGMEEIIFWLVIAVGVLVVVAIAYSIMTGKANSAIEYIKNLMNFGK